MQLCKTDQQFIIFLLFMNCMFYRPHSIHPAVREGIREHVLSFPRQLNHYSRMKGDVEREYLSPDLNLLCMFRLYKENNPTSTSGSIGTSSSSRTSVLGSQEVTQGVTRNVCPVLKINSYYNRWRKVEDRSREWALPPESWKSVHPVAGWHRVGQSQPNGWGEDGLNDGCVEVHHQIGRASCRERV